MNAYDVETRDEKTGYIIPIRVEALTAEDARYQVARMLVKRMRRFPSSGVIAITKIERVQ